jgi:predicted metalloprotease
MSSPGRPARTSGTGVARNAAPILVRRGRPCKRGEGLSGVPCSRGRQRSRTGKGHTIRWTSRGRSRDLEDRRGQGGFRRAPPIGIGGLLILVVLSLITGQDSLLLADPGGGTLDTSTSSSQPYAPTPEEEKLVEFVSFVLDDSQDVWTQLLGRDYQRARLVLFNDGVESAWCRRGFDTGRPEDCNTFR